MESWNLLEVEIEAIHSGVLFDGEGGDQKV